MNPFNLQLQMQKQRCDVLHKTLNSDIWNDPILCEIKTASRWQQVTVNKWVIATEPNHLNDWFIQERITVMLLRDAKQCCSCLELFCD